MDKALVWKPDLILLDVFLPVLAGFVAASEIKQHQPHIPILFFSIYATDEILKEAGSVGDGFILKETVVEMLPKAVDALLQKQSFFPAVDLQ